MRRILVLLVLLLRVAAASAQTSSDLQAPVTYPELGGGFNGLLGDIDNSLILQSGIKWARAYVNVQRNFLTFTDCPGPGCRVGVLDTNILDRDPGGPADTTSPAADVLAIYAVEKLVKTRRVFCQSPPATRPCPQFRIILSLKLDFKYQGAGIPEPGSSHETSVFQAVTRFLTNNDLGSQIDILVLGNEPMFETPLGATKEERAAAAKGYATFLSRFIDMASGLRTHHPPYAGTWGFKIFTGSLDRPYSYVGRGADAALKDEYGPIIQSIIDVTTRNPNASGIDLHEHVMSIKDAANDVDYVNRMFLLGGARREVISTEFSLVQLWDKNLNTPSQLPGPPANLCDQVNRMIEAAAAGTPVSSSRFQGFLRGQTSWYPKTQNGLGWFAQFYCMFHRRSNVSVVTYGLERSPQYPYELDLLETDPPGSTHCKAGVHSWVMISAYDGATMGTSTSRGSASFGSFNANPLVFPEFEKVVSNPAKVCADLTPWP